MYQRKYYSLIRSRFLNRGEQNMTNLAGAHLIEGDKGKCLRKHGRWQVFFG